MQLNDIIWKNQFIDKLATKHNVSTDEVEEILFNSPYVRKAKKGNVQGENVYVAYNQTYSGRYLVVFFIYKINQSALPISARDMTEKERRYYEKQKPQY